MTWTAPQITRTDEPFIGSERTILDGYLDWHRTTLLHKCAGLTGEQLCQASTPPSNLTLLGLVRHMTDVERGWFRRRVAGQQIESLYSHTDGRGGASFDLIDPADAAGDLDRLVQEWQHCRDAVADLDLTAEFVHERSGARMSLRWVYVHMIEEYARHNGHADLLRERIDGTTGA
ncbi:DinB family protein [Catellatospora tritici]|uniref:DinB family protein n=1 Tax=Catellatospora tritici TaxID=2851566 RepID=UPI001C2DEE16|nr:DinB family protein [Catellatospora tritici]MBV1850864.1 DinB family protein [Catellatospora tritici]MBV1851117.1 DinB family protein [Catellatospora tritici]